MFEPKNLRGVDVYRGDGVINWQKVYNDGVRFACIKATEGVTITDARMFYNLTEARKAGLYCGLYHYFLPTGNAWAQSEYYMEAVRKAVGAKTKKEAFSNLLVPLLDLEDAGDMEDEALVNSALAFIKHVQETIGRGCIVYTYPYFITEHLVEASKARYLAGYPLWIASYPKDGQPGRPYIPALWKTATMQQYTDHGSQPGIPRNGGVDLDVFFGDAQAMEHFVVH